MRPISCTTSFFFQAEDGIRDLTVTGVDVCSSDLLSLREQGYDVEIDSWIGLAYPKGVPPALRDRLERVAMAAAEGPQVRSEERRVGKECRSRWSPYH